MDDLENAANSGEGEATPANAAAIEELVAIGVKHTSVDKTGAWDAGANLKRLGDKPGKASLRAMHAWVDSAKDQETKAAYKLPHHNVSADGKVGAANMKAVASAMGRLNGGGLDIPQADRKGVYDHLAAHYKDAGMTAPDLKASAEADRAQYFGAEDEGDSGEMAEFVPSTADADKGTIDCVWYGGQTVPRIDYSSGDQYMLKLDMAGCRMDRLNSGAPVFDNHMTGSDFKSVISGKAGTRAQIGVVQNAWTDGEKGMATLKFDLGSEDGAEMFRKVAGGIVRNLSFGAWINEVDKTEKEGEITQAVATDWEPFEISPVGVPADYSTQFLSAEGVNPSRQSRGIQPKGDDQMDETKLAAARDEGNKEGLKAGAALERQRVADIQAMAKPFKLDEKFLSGLIEKGLSLDDSRKEVMTELAARAEKDANGKEFKPRGEFAEVTRDAAETRFAQMQASLLLRHNGQFFMAKKMDHRGDPTGQFQPGNGPEKQQKMEDLGREYRGFSLLEMAKESLVLRGVNPRGMSKMEIARCALEVKAASYFSGGAESTSDFPSILANVANKTLRLAYEAYPRTFEPFSRQVTAQDFKPVNRVQLSDAPALEKLNEEGEFRRAKLSDTNQNYSLATFGKIVAITRKVIINDDLQAFTRVPAILGVAAARLESDTVWAVITGNQVMAEDTTALFHTNHKNSLTGTASSIDPAVNTTPISAMNAARAKMRLQKAQQGTPLNLVPRFAAAPAALESYLLQLTYPINIASSDSTKVVPEWVRSLVPVIEPRLDAASATAWYMIADPAQIDTIEHCYLEGQEGVYIETQQGFDVDGIEIKARMDFAAAAIDFRGMQKNAGA